MYSSVIEDDEVESDDETFFESDYDEAKPTRPSFAKYKPSKTGQQSYYSPRNGQYVSQQQLQAALAKIRQDVQKTSATVGTVNKRIDSTQNTVKAQGVAIDKTQKQLKSARADFQNLSQTAMLMPLLTLPKATAPLTGNLTASDGSIAVPAGTSIDISTGNNTTLLLLMMMMMSSSTSTSSSTNGSTNSGGMDQMTMLLLVLALSGGSL